MDNGSLKSKKYYKTDKLISEIRFRYWDNGNIRSQVNLKNNKKDGETLYYFQSGSVKEKIYYENNKVISYINFTYHKNGKLEKKNVYNKENELEESLTYHDNGQLKYKGVYKKGQRDGEWIEYDENGDITNKTLYKNGMKVYQPTEQEIKQSIMRRIVYQITENYSLPVSVHEIENINIKIKINIEKDGFIKTITLDEDTIQRAQNNPKYNIYVEAAERAIKKLGTFKDLPKKHYDLWNVIEINFSPS